jgi:hypothetical protein
VDRVSNDVAHKKEREKRCENVKEAMPKEVHEALH